MRGSIGDWVVRRAGVGGEDVMAGTALREEDDRMSDWYIYGGRIVLSDFVC